MRNANEVQKVLSQDLEQADPTVYQIIERVGGHRSKLCKPKNLQPTFVGKKPTEALHQPDSLGELYLTSCSRCSW